MATRSGASSVTWASTGRLAPPLPAPPPAPAAVGLTALLPPPLRVRRLFRSSFILRRARIRQLRTQSRDRRRSIQTEERGGSQQTAQAQHSSQAWEAGIEQE